MDPLLDRLTAGASRRWIVVAVLVAALLLAAAIVIAGLGASGSGTTLPAVRVASAPAPTPSPLLVQVGGAVRRPGLVSVPSGARVVDAVTAAGGPTGDADASGVNLAAPVADGQQVLVPAKGSASSPASTAAADGGSASTAPVSLNSATEAQLETLPRIGPGLAARILAWRTAHGAFRSIDDLGKVGGIGPKTLAGLRDLVTL